MPAVMQCTAKPADVLPTKQLFGNKHADEPRVSKHPLDIIDIRSNKDDFNLKDEVASMMNPGHGGVRKLPTLLLYDERGLQLFEDITYLDEYYLTNFEIELLKNHSAEIASQIPEGSMLIELGSGNLRKVCLLLQAFENAGKTIDYYALDLSQKELERTLSHVPQFNYVSCHGLLGTYDDGRDWLKQPDVVNKPKCILTLGSSIGNFSRDEAAEFLQTYVDVLQPRDSMIVGLDACCNPDQVYHAYNDSKGITHQFILNGLRHANSVYNETLFNIDEWSVIGEYVFDIEGGRHQAFVSPLRDVTVLGSVIKAQERVQIEQSHKYSQIGSDNLWKQSGLHEIGAWSHEDEYGLHLLRKSKVPFSKAPTLYAAGALPTMQDWESLWQAWDIVTKGMLPKQELTEKPIKLRNACIFYLGHIPTFLDIQLTKTTKQPPTEPASYYSIFERGVDPDVDNPEHCHAHSEIPDEWPPVEEITAFQTRVRSRLRNLYANGQERVPRSVGRAIWVGFEHELMHIETLLYMMLQSDKTLPPPHTALPNFERLAHKAYESRVPNQWFDVPEQVVTLGMNDPEESTDVKRHYGWDNEKPQRLTKVHAFQAQGRAITNEEYAKYMYGTNNDKIPASWSFAAERTSSPDDDSEPQTNGAGRSRLSSSNSTNNGYTKPLPTDLPESFLKGKSVRTMYGLVPLEYALDWPVFASYDELAGCASWMGGRIPTFEEAKSIYAFVESQKDVSTGDKLAKKVPAVNGHLVNDGVEETPPSHSSSSVDDGSQLFIDLAGANVGFKHWHPVPVSPRGGQLAGQADLGGVWEWTSSPLRKHDGFVPMELYPLYTADFFDEKHNVVLGGSWATHPRIAGRKSFVNWYQRNYSYAWVGARLVRDI